MIFFFFFQGKSEFISLMNTKLVFSLMATATLKNTALDIHLVK